MKVGGGSIGYMEVENSFNNSAKSGGRTQVLRALDLVLASSVFAFNKQIYIPDTLLIQLYLISVLFPSVCPLQGANPRLVVGA